MLLLFAQVILANGVRVPLVLEAGYLTVLPVNASLELRPEKHASGSVTLFGYAYDGPNITGRLGQRLSDYACSFFILKSYRVGSVNFSQLKLGHAHDNSADSENVAGAHEPSVHAHFIFRFENGQGNQSLFSTHDQNTAETSQPQAQPTDG